MAAFTTFSKEALERYLIMFGKGQLAHYAPTPGGIENSNYFIRLDMEGQETEFVLTIMETHSFAEVPFFNKVLSQLKYDGLPVAAPVATLDGMTSTIFCGKPAFLFDRLEGSHPESANHEQCAALGAFTASVHQALSELKLTRDNPYDLMWMKQALDTQGYRLSKADRTLLTDMIHLNETIQSEDLPRGLIHGDLFRDNALFSGESLAGVVDFYHSCTDTLIQDLAIAINDWCKNSKGDLDESRRSAMISAYESIRPLSVKEHEWLAPMQQVSAARFALTRLESGDPPLKDPREMLNLIEQIQASE